MFNTEVTTGKHQDTDHNTSLYYWSFLLGEYCGWLYCNVI